MSSNKPINRRDFVKGTAATAGAALTGALAGCVSGKSHDEQTAHSPPTATHTASATAASKQRVLGANERIRVGMIGVGGMGSGHLRGLVRNSTTYNCDVVGVSDVYSKRREYAAAHAACPEYLDYKKLLDRNDIDAVVIASPDHWHAPMTIDAIQSGKDVYCEKPMTYTAEEALKVRDTVDQYGAVMQVGTQYTSMDCYWRARQAIADNRIGKVVWAQTAFSRNGRVGEWNYYNIDKEGNEQTIDWNRFLGSRPKRPFDADRFFRWRKYWDYSGGVATDLFYHRLAPMLLAIGPSFPMRVTAGGGIWIQKDGRDVPDTFFLTIDYPTDFSICILASMCNAFPLDTAIRGQWGTMIVDESDGNIKIKGEKDWIEEFKGVNNGQTEVQEDKIPGRDWYEGHMANFLECVRTRNRPNCDARLGAMTMVTVAAGVKAFREQKVIKIDPSTGKLI